MSGAMLGMYEGNKGILLALGLVQACDMADHNRGGSTDKVFSCRRFCTTLVLKEDLVVLFMEPANALLRMHSYRTERCFCSEGG